MKKIIITLALIIYPIFSYGQSDYFNGYKAGYCQGDIACIAPIPPVAEPGKNSYADGFKRGAIASGKDVSGIDYSGLLETNKELGEAKTEFSNSISKGIDEGLSPLNSIDIYAYANAMNANARSRGTPGYFPNVRKKSFKKLKIQKYSNDLSVNLRSSSNVNDDPMYLTSKLYQAFKSNGLLNTKSSNRIVFNYNYRADTGCGGVVIDNLNFQIFDRTGEMIAVANFRQSQLEGKCIDDVIYQMVKKLIE